MKIERLLNAKTAASEIARLDEETVTRIWFRALNAMRYATESISSFLGKDATIALGQSYASVADPSSNTWLETDYWVFDDECVSTGKFRPFESLELTYNDPNNILHRTIEFFEGLKTCYGEPNERALEAFLFVTGLAAELLVEQSGFKNKIEDVYRQKEFRDFADSLVR